MGTRSLARYAGGIRKDHKASYGLRTAEARFAFGRYKMAEIREFKGGNRQKDIDKEVFDLLNEAKPLKNADRNPLAEIIEKSCMILIPEKIMDKLLNKLDSNRNTEIYTIMKGGVFMFKRGDSWYSDFWYKGEHYTESHGPVSKTIARETAISNQD